LLKQFGRPLSDVKTDAAKVERGLALGPSPFFQRAGLSFQVGKKGWIILSPGLDYSFIAVLNRYKSISCALRSARGQFLAKKFGRNISSLQSHCAGHFCHPNLGALQ